MFDYYFYTRFVINIIEVYCFCNLLYKQSSITSGDSTEINGTLMNDSEWLVETVNLQVVDHVIVELEIPSEPCTGLDESWSANTPLPPTCTEESVIISLLNIIAITFYSNSIIDTPVDFTDKSFLITDYRLGLWAYSIIYYTFLKRGYGYLSITV